MSLSIVETSKYPIIFSSTIIGAAMQCHFLEFHNNDTGVISQINLVQNQKKLSD